MKANPPSRWKWQWLSSGLVAALFLASGCATQSPTAADERLEVPANPAERAYLGLSAESTRFELGDIHCGILVVYCFDMYCHVCQSGAVHVNELYQLTRDHGRGERIKFVGLGVGDTPLETVTYQRKLGVPFPVFPDRHTAIARRFGPVRLPNLLVLRNRGGRLEFIQSITGTLLNPAEVLTHIEAELMAVVPHGWHDPAQAVQATCDERSKACRIPAPRVVGATNQASIAWE